MRFSNEDLIRRFSNGYTSGRSFSGNLYIEGDKLINYWTTIAKRNEEGNVVLNSDKYSRTTSKIQGYIRRICDVVQEVSEEELERI